MNSFFVAFVVLGCALSAQADCTFPYADALTPRGDGGVFYPNPDPNNMTYIPGSVLVWCDVAENSRQFANADGQEHLDYWDTASRIFDDCMQAEDYPCANKAIAQANYCFCKIVPDITKPELATYYQSVCTNFGALLNEGNYAKINAFMINAFKEFNRIICGA